MPDIVLGQEPCTKADPSCPSEISPLPKHYLHLSFSTRKTAFRQHSLPARATWGNGHGSRLCPRLRIGQGRKRSWTAPGHVFGPFIHSPPSQGPGLAGNRFPGFSWFPPWSPVIPVFIESQWFVIMLDSLKLQFYH